MKSPLSVKLNLPQNPISLDSLILGLANLKRVSECAAKEIGVQVLSAEVSVASYYADPSVVQEIDYTLVIEHPNADALRRYSGVIKVYNSEYFMKG